MFEISEQIVVVDIDQTCVYTLSIPFTRVDKKEREMLKTTYQKRLYFIHIRDGDGIGGGDSTIKMWGVKRPGLAKFIAYLHRRFKYVIFWTAGTNAYAKKLVPIIYSDNPGLKPFRVFSREHCTFTPGGDRTKPLRLLKSLTRGSEIPVELTFLIDDQIYSGYENPDNQILIPEYLIDEKMKIIQQILKPDDALEVLSKWFNLPIVKESRDIRKLDKTHIF